MQRISPLIGPPDPHHEDCTCCVPAPLSQEQVIPEISGSKFEGLRDLHISYDLLQTFLRYVESNTKKGIESCGVLAGKFKE